ncbi:hypothetical protein EXIGLDRAFT_717153 [Exidia glandulosa HHB12029]|uniref:Asl1-like glycosyl hydrolase catalytic domain-containing protein n=1 Tax=Exidia glandulosa HHB12029 TaxID=1314781 RepID=A0A165IHX8_EXIGL|nr:hypothetical protein EXIGLDRAFT_717153 [Exidia glandulosa HHB12029]
MARLSGFAATAAFAILACTLGTEANNRYIPGRAVAARSTGISARAANAHGSVNAPKSHAKKALGKRRRSKKKCAPTSSDPVPAPEPTSSDPAPAPPSSDPVPQPTSTEAPAPPPPSTTPPSSTEAPPPPPTSTEAPPPPPPSTTEAPPPPPTTTEAPPPPPPVTTEAPPPPPPTTTEAPPPPPPTTTEAPPPPPTTEAPAPPPPAPPVNARKVGIAADWTSPKEVVANFKGDNTVGVYNWSPWKFDNLPDGVDFWPMLHGEESIADWGHVTSGYATKAMGCNEVNQQGQSTMNVQRGIDIWKQYLMPLKGQGYQLISHSTNQADDGTQWHKDFKDQCGECYDSIDAYSVHWYGTSADNFKSYVSGFHSALGKDIYVTEFACTDFSGQTTCDPGQAKALMDDLTDWMKQPEQDYIKGFFWFGMWPSLPGGVSPANTLVNGDGSPNDLGNNYKSK